MGKVRAKADKGHKEHTGKSDMMDGLLSPELMAELGGGDGIGGAMAVAATKPGKGKKRGRTGDKVSSETRELAATMSKSKAKKLKQLEDKRVKDGRRAELYRKLEEHQMSQNHLSLLRSSKTISMKQDTLRLRIKQAVQHAVAGISLAEADVRELESHPEVVADVEEALSLPVGGALAATRKVSPVASQSGDAAVMGAVEAKREHTDKRSGAMKAVHGSMRVDPAVSATAAVGKKSTRTATSPAIMSKKRTKSMRAAVPRQVQVMAVTRPRSSSGSSMDDSSSDSDVVTNVGGRTPPANTASELSHERTNDEVNTQEEAGCGTINASHPDDAHSKVVQKVLPMGVDISPSTEEGAAVATAGIAPIEGDSPAEVSGSTWAAKMMSSLAQMPKGKGNVEKSGSNDDPSSGDQASVAVASGAVGGENESDEHADSPEDDKGGSRSGVGAPTSYPPPPDWLDGNAPAYHAKETPLPSLSGDSPSGGAGGGATAGADACGSTLPRPERWVPVERPVELQAARMQLPVCGLEQEITEAVHDNDTLILCGETGSGKSTQVPQFLYEAGYARHGLIGITQPRRVAAVGTAERVAVELGTNCGRDGAVAYQIRYDASGVGENTRVKFMTDGVLLQEITSDLLLRKYSVVLLDEAHERNLNTDVLLGMLSRSIPLRKQIAEEEQRSWRMLSDDRKKEVKLPLRPLKLIIMSATLRVTDFTENKLLFSTPPPVITANSRQHSVTVHFNKRTELYDYVGETFKKVCKVHQRLPNGGILVFLTGKREILHMCDKLRREFPPPRAPRKRDHRSGCDTENDDVADATREEEGPEEVTDSEKHQAKGKKRRRRSGKGANISHTDTENDKEAMKAEPKSREKPIETDRETLLFREADDDEEDAARLADMEGRQESDRDDITTAGDGGAVAAEREGKVDEHLSDASDDNDDDDDGAAVGVLPPVHVVPLYAMLTAEEQAKVFRPPPDGHRLVVVATNVAETSITIPGISYVVDSGRQKRRVVQRGSGISQFEVGWVSKASADQRAGRAGRTGPGHCYRLYSSAVYTQTLEAFAPPEVLTRPLEDVMLQMKAMGVVDVSRFPFPTPPDAAGLRSAAILLANLGATVGRGNIGSGGDDRGGEGDGTGEITAVGKALALLPVGARYAKMLLLAVQGGLLAHAAALVAMLTEGDPFVKADAAKKVDDEDGPGGARGKAQSSEQGTVRESEIDAEEMRRKRAQWSHPNSDALARLKAAGAYSHATSGGTSTGGGEFCRENLLHGPTMDRSFQLRRQLSRLVRLRFGTEPGWKECDLAGTLRPPSRRQSDALRQVLLSGLLDNVARRAPAGTVKAGSKLQRDCAYLSCNAAITEPLYIKSNSVLFSRDPQELPEWVVYQDIIRGEREGAPASMTCVSAIEAAWLPALAEGSPLLSFSAPLVAPPPTYDAGGHLVMCRVTPRYGVHAWELPPHLTELAAAAPANKPDLVFRWFGRLLLEGGVVGCLSELRKRDMLNDPPTLLTREAPTKKVGILVLELRRRGVSSLPALVQQWRRDPKYLKASVELWVKVGCKAAFEKAWLNAIKTGVLALSSGDKKVSGQGDKPAPSDEGGVSGRKRKKASTELK